MHRTATIVILALLASAVIAAGAGFAYIYSGSYNVAATEPHNALSRWLLDTTKQRSVRTHAQSVGSPPPSSEEELRHGVEHYHNTCLRCHGAPGIERGELGKGMTPKPPDLSEAADEWSEQEIFWIVRNGIKFTGMPAFAPTHTDNELWSLAAFVKRLPGMTPERYRQLSAGLSQRPRPGPADGSDRHQ